MCGAWAIVYCSLWEDLACLCLWTSQTLYTHHLSWHYRKHKQQKIRRFIWILVKLYPKLGHYTLNWQRTENGLTDKLFFVYTDLLWNWQYTPPNESSTGLSKAAYATHILNISLTSSLFGDDWMVLSFHHAAVVRAKGHQIILWDSYISVIMKQIIFCKHSNVRIS